MKTYIVTETGSSIDRTYQYSSEEEVIQHYKDSTGESDYSLSAVEVDEDGTQHEVYARDNEDGTWEMDYL